MSSHAFDVLRTGVKVDKKRFGGHMPSKAAREHRFAVALPHRPRVCAPRPPNRLQLPACSPIKWMHADDALRNRRLKGRCWRWRRPSVAGLLRDFSGPRGRISLAQAGPRWQEATPRAFPGLEARER